jgi:hypothetical protein
MKAGKKKPLDWPSGAVGFVFTCGGERIRITGKKGSRERERREYLFLTNLV